MASTMKSFQIHFITSKELVTLEIEVLNIEFSQLGSHENFYTDLSKKK